MVNAYQPSLTSTWMFQKSMSVGVGEKVDPNLIVDLLANNFKSMDKVDLRYDRGTTFFPKLLMTKKDPQMKSYPVGLNTMCFTVTFVVHIDHGIDQWIAHSFFLVVSVWVR